MIQQNWQWFLSLEWFRIHAPKVPFNFHFKIGMEKDIFVYFNFISKLKIEKKNIFENWMALSVQGLFRYLTFIFHFSFLNWKTNGRFGTAFYNHGSKISWGEFFLFYDPVLYLDAPFLCLQQLVLPQTQFFLLFRLQ